jgi:hypothetical protein
MQGDECGDNYVHQRKWNIGSDFVMVKPIEDISVSFMQHHYKNPYAG